MRVLRQFDGIRTCPVCVPGRSYATRHNTKPRYVKTIPGRLSAVPPPAVSTWLRNRMAATESGKVLAYRITDQETAEPVALHALDLFDGQQGIGHQLVVAEYGVVAPLRHAAMVAA